MTASDPVPFVAAVTGVPDADGDEFAVGSFRASLARREPRITATADDWSAPVGRVVGLVEVPPGDRRLPRRTPDGRPWPRTAGALLGGAIFNTATAAGAAAYREAKSVRGVLGLGFHVAESRRRGRVREITRAELFTLAPPAGAATETKGTDDMAYEVKAAAGARPWERDREDDERDGSRRRSRPMEPGKIDAEELDDLDDADDDVAIEMSPDGLSVLSCLTCGRSFGWADAPARVAVCEDCARRSAQSSARRGARSGAGIAGRGADESSPALRQRFPRQPVGSREPGADAAGDPRYTARPDGTLSRDEDERGGRRTPPPMRRRA